MKITFYDKDKDDSEGRKEITAFQFAEMGGIKLNPTHNFKKLKEFRLIQFEEKKEEFINERKFEDVETSNSDLISFYGFWLDGELETIDMWLSETYPKGRRKSIKTSISHKIEIEKYKTFINSEIQKTKQNTQINTSKNLLNNSLEKIEKMNFDEFAKLNYDLLTRVKPNISHEYNFDGVINNNVYDGINKDLNSEDSPTFGKPIVESIKKELFGYQSSSNQYLNNICDRHLRSIIEFKQLYSQNKILLKSSQQGLLDRLFEQYNQLCKWFLEDFYIWTEKNATTNFDSFIGIYKCLFDIIDPDTRLFNFDPLIDDETNKIHENHVFCFKKNTKEYDEQHFQILIRFYCNKAIKEVEYFLANSSDFAENKTKFFNKLLELIIRDKEISKKFNIYHAKNGELMVLINDSVRYFDVFTKWYVKKYEIDVNAAYREFTNNTKTVPESSQPVQKISEQKAAEINFPLLFMDSDTFCLFEYLIENYENKKKPSKISHLFHFITEILGEYKMQQNEYLDYVLKKYEISVSKIQPKNNKYYEVAKPRLTLWKDTFNGLKIVE